MLWDFNIVKNSILWKFQYCGDFNIVWFQYCGDFNIVEISILWRFQYCGDFNIVRFQSREISILWRFQHCEILISWYFNLRKLCVTSRNLEKWVKRVGRSLRRLGQGGMSRKHASSQNWIKKLKNLWYLLILASTSRWAENMLLAKIKFKKKYICWYSPQHPDEPKTCF